MNRDVSILLVEDNMSDAEMTISSLRTNKLANSLLHVKDGAEALDFIFAEGAYLGRRPDNLPRLILLDLKMPKVNGIEVLQRIKSTDLTRAIPIVVLTSSKEDPDIRKCYALGVNSYVVKPVEFHEFQKSISNLGLYWMIVNQASQ